MGIYKYTTIHHQKLKAFQLNPERFMISRYIYYFQFHTRDGIDGTCGKSSRDMAEDLVIPKSTVCDHLKWLNRVGVLDDHGSNRSPRRVIHDWFIFRVFETPDEGQEIDPIPEAFLEHLSASRTKDQKTVRKPDKVRPKAGQTPPENCPKAGQTPYISKKGINNSLKNDPQVNGSIGDGAEAPKKETPQFRGSPHKKSLTYFSNIVNFFNTSKPGRTHDPPDHCQQIMILPL